MAIITGKIKSANRDLVMNLQSNFKKLQQLKYSSMGEALSILLSEEVLIMQAVTVCVYKHH